MVKKAKSNKRDPKRQKRNTRFAWITVIIFGVILLSIGGVISYQKAKYAAAPAEIKLIRTLPIYNYESDNLKIVRRSEDYGGYDWKHVYNEPEVYLKYGGSGNPDEKVQDINDHLLKNGWTKSSEVSTGNRVIRYYRLKKGPFNLEVSVTLNKLSGEISLFINKF